MIDYSIDDLYNEGYISGEVYYLCDENGISCLKDAIPTFSQNELPNYIEALKSVFLELSDGKIASNDIFSNWKDDCIQIANTQNKHVASTIQRFHSFAAFVLYVKSNKRLFDNRFDSNTYKEEIDKYWNTKLPDTIDDSTSAWRIGSKDSLKKYNPSIRRAFSTLIDFYPNREMLVSDLKTKSFIDDILCNRMFGKVGSITVGSIINILLSYLESINHTEHIHSASTIMMKDETWLQSIFEESLKPYSVRTYNALHEEKKQYSSYYSFFNWIISPAFNPLSIRNVGKKSAGEIRNWKKCVIDTIMVKQDRTSAGEPESAYFIGTTVNSKPEYLFDDFFSYVSTMKDSRKNLANHIATSISISNVSEIGISIHLHRERVRQLIPSVTNDIRSFFSKKHETHDYTKEEYFTIANNCGHHLNDQFIIWVGSIVSNEIAVVGSFEKYICKGEPLMAIDGRFASVFDFNQFVSSVKSLSEKKYYELTKVNIESIVLDCFINNVQFEHLPAIIRECRAILYNQFPYHLSESDIIIPANAYYSIRQRVENILEREKKPLTIELIRKRLSETGVTFEGSDNQLASMIRKSSQIVSYGNPTKFGLMIWGTLEENKSGTIRDIAINLLLNHTPHLIPKEELISNLLSIYKESNERSIINNLISDSKQRFGLYQKGRCVYVGLTNETYDSSFTLNLRGESKNVVSLTLKNASWQGTLDSIKRVLLSRNWIALDKQQRKWLVTNWKKVQQGSLPEWQSSQIIELIENSKKR